MSLSLVTHPVITSGGITYNVFAGFLPCELIFKREDLAINTITAGLDNNIQINISLNLTSKLSVGDSVYVYAVGDVTGYVYDETAEVTAITSSYVTLDIVYIESASSGYINYLKNYYVEAQLVDTVNSNIKKIDFNLQDNGDNAGNITIDVSIANDKNYKYFKAVTGEFTNSRIRFNVQYRQVYDDSSESFTIIDNPIILVYGSGAPAVESFENDFDEPKIYKGYDSGVVLIHSDRNNAGNDAIDITYDELDINQDNITTGNVLATLDADLYGQIFIFWDKATSLNANTQYIKFKGAFTSLPDFEPTEFTSDFEIT